MDGYLTSSFLQQFPKKLMERFILSNTTFHEFFRAIHDGTFVASTDEKALLDLLEYLKSSDNEIENSLYRGITSMYDSSKLQSKQKVDAIPDSFKKLTIKKSILTEVGGALSQKASSVFHDSIGNGDWKEQLMRIGSKPIFENDELSSGSIHFLFKEKSIPINIGDDFNWSRFLSDFVMPFKSVRILDPYLYTNINDVKLVSLLKTISRKSNSGLNIEIISDLTADRKRAEEEVLEKVKNELSDFGDSAKITLYSQKGSASNVFHKRLIWTDFWVVHTDRGLDFVKLATGQGKAKQENTLFMAGKYASKESIWYQVNNNWSDYVDRSRVVSI